MTKNPRLTAAASAVLFAFAVGCGDDSIDSERSESMPVIPPFDSIANVRLPTTLGSLVKLRPQARQTDFGLRERVGGIDVSYFADRDPGNEVHPPPMARVEHVEAAWVELSDDSASSLWRSSVANLTHSLGVPVECFRTSQSVAFARWRAPSGAIAYVRRQHSVEGPVRQSAGFSVGFSVDTATLAPALTGAPKTPCAEPYGMGSSNPR